MQRFMITKKRIASPQAARNDGYSNNISIQRLFRFMAGQNTDRIIA
jgi:hypothetical protein